MEACSKKLLQRFVRLASLLALVHCFARSPKYTLRGLRKVNPSPGAVEAKAEHVEGSAGISCLGRKESTRDFAFFLDFGVHQFPEFLSVCSTLWSVLSVSSVLYMGF